MNRKAVPFTPVIRGTTNQAEQAAEQLNGLIEQNAARGWDFVELANIGGVVPGGCLGGSPTVTNVQLAIFEERRSA